MNFYLKYQYIFYIGLLFSIHSYAQQYPVADIPADLKTDANAVIRLDETIFVQQDMNNAIEKNVKVITVFNGKGRGLSDIAISQGRFQELKSFSGEIYLESGKLFRKIGKGDLSVTAYSDHLASDDYYSYYTCPAPSYPYTVKYTYEVKWKNGLAYYPSFFPVPSFACAVEKSVYKLQFPASMSIRYKGNDYAPLPERRVENKDSVYTWMSEKIKAISWEPLCPSITELTPFLLVTPNDFCFDKVCGNLSTWKGVGLFLKQLQEQRDILPTETVAKVREMTSSAQSEKEKVAILYKYLQEKTRYVSIKLGIGGWQPLTALQVDKTGFGDCKALTNYMKALLASVDIKSEYAIVHTDKKRMFKDFSTPTQANHVILQVPLENDTVWLECTSRTLPFGYIYRGIADHDVLLVSGEQSKLCTVPDTPEKIHAEINYISVKLQDDGDMISSVTSNYKNHKMEPYLNFVLHKPEKERINQLARSLSLNKTQISNIQTEYLAKEYPEITIKYDLYAEKYANKTGNRLFLSMNPFRNEYNSIFSSSSRKLPLRLPSPVHQTDSVLIELPKGYVVESSLRPVSIESTCGTFSSSIIENDGKLLIVQQVHIPAGKYSPESYAEIKEFFKQIDGNLSGRVVLRKEETNKGAI